VPVLNAPMDVFVFEEGRREEDGEVEREELKVAVKGEVEEGRKLPAPPMEVLMCFCFCFGDERERREEVLVVEE
jgi:hypothetical protein